MELSCAAWTQLHPHASDLCFQAQLSSDPGSPQPEACAGAQMWGQVFTHVITALLLFQVIMAALLAIKQSFSAILVSSLCTALMRLHSAACPGRL